MVNNKFIVYSYNKMYSMAFEQFIKWNFVYSYNVLCKMK